MSNFKKFVAGFSTIAMAVSMFAFAPAVDAATAGGVYKTTDGTVWFVTKDMQKRPFTSAGAFMSYGFLSFSQVMEADSSVTSLPSGSFIAPQDGRIFCATETKGSDVAGECSLITGGKKAAFTSAAVFTGQGYSFSRAYYGDSSFLEKTSNIDNASAQHRPGTLINNNGTVQLVVNGGLWGVPSMDVFNSWGWSFADVVPANSADVLLSQTGVIPARQAGDLVPTATSNGGGSQGDCNLDGGAGSLNSVTNISGISNEEVGEGEEDVEVAGVELEADNGSDLEVTSVRLTFAQGTATNDSFEDFVDEVKIWADGEEVASIDGDEFNEDNDYSRSITIDGCAEISSDDSIDLTVSVSGNDNLDSADLGDTWTVSIDSIRYSDAQGVTTTDSTTGDLPSSDTFSLESFATANDVELEVALNEDDEDINDGHIIDIDDTGSTSDEEILSFTLEATGDSDINVDEIPVLFTTTGTTDESTVIESASLYMGSEELDTQDVTAGGFVTFEDLDIDVDAGEMVELMVKVDIASLDDINDGDTVMAQINDTTDCDTVTGGTQTCVDLIDAEDQNGDELGTGELIGAANGEAHALYDNGIMVEFVDSSATKTFTADEVGESDQGTYKITFTVEAFGDVDQRIDRSCIEDQVDAAGQGVEYTITNAASNSTTCNLTSTTTDSEDTANTFEIDRGSARTFTLTVVATASSSHFAEVALASINWGTATDNTNANYYTFNLEDFKTDAVNLIDL